MAQLCTLSICTADECKTSVGGALNAWFINKSAINLAEITLESTEGDNYGAITGWTNTSGENLLYLIPAQFETLGGGFPFANPQSASAQYFNHTVQLSKPGISQKDINQIAQLMTGRFTVIVETRQSNNLGNNENVHLVFGLENGLTLESGESQLGVSRDDLPGAALVWSGPHQLPPREIQPATGTIADIIDALGECVPTPAY